MSGKFSDDRYEGSLHPEAANVCLYLGKDGDGFQHEHSMDSEALRMAYVSWDDWSPYLMMRLNSAERGLLSMDRAAIVGRRPSAKRFAMFPDFPRSMISKNVATAFGLRTVKCGIQLCFPTAMGRLLPSVNKVPIVVKEMCWAATEIIVSPSVSPRVAVHVPIGFLVLDSAPQEFAMVGRDLLKRLLLLYRGTLARPLESSSINDDLPGRVYIGGQ